MTKTQDAKVERPLNSSFNELVLKHQLVIQTSLNVYEICNKKTRYEYATFPVHFVEIRPCKKDMQNIKVHRNSTMPIYFF